MNTAKAWTANVTLAVLCALHCWRDAVAQTAAAVPAGQRPVRVALLQASRGPATAAERQGLPEVMDLLTARLTGTAGFELVERSALAAILRELALSASSLTKPTEAVQVGRMLKADWLVLLSFPKGITNAVLGKILDASTGGIRDLQLVPWQPNDSAGAAEVLTAFVVASSKPGIKAGARLWVGFGGFEDLGLYHRYRDFGERLRTAMTLKYAGTRVSIVERSQVRPLLDELNLSLGGFTEVKTNQTAAQPAFVLVDGLYQAFQDEQSKINLVLRMEWVGGRRSAVTIKELPGAPLEAKVMEAVDRFLAESPAAGVTNSLTRQAEAMAQIIRGRELGRTGRGYSDPGDGVIAWTISPRDRAPQVREGISAFESALFLVPEDLDARFGLAWCFADPVIDEVEKARDIWREIAATTTNEVAATAARSALAGSYVGRNDVQALELLTALRNASTNLAARGRLNARMRPVRHRLAAAGKLVPADVLEFAVDAWRTDCRLAELRVAEKRSIDAYMTFSNPMADFGYAFTGPKRDQARQEYIGGVVSNLAREFPRLEPYLVSSYAGGDASSPYWVERYRNTLAFCAENPGAIPDPTSYFTTMLMEDLRSFIDRQEYEWADRVVRVFEKGGRNFLFTRSNQDELDFLTGHVRFKLKRFDEAIAAFERIGSRQVTLGRVSDVWANDKGRFISGIRAAEICRQHAGLAGNPAAAKGQVDLKPVQVLPGTEIIFAVDREQIWMTDRIGFYRYLFQGGLLEPFEAKVNPRVRRVLVHQDKVWFATAEGLYGFDPRDGAVVTNAINQGLLMPSVTALVADGQRIWTGFGTTTKAGENIGGLGYLDLVENRFVGLMSDLPASLATARPDKRDRDPGLQPEGAQRRFVTGLARSASGLLWVSTSSRLLRRDVGGPGTWQTAISGFSGAIPAEVVANDDYVVVPTYETSGWSSMDTNFGGVFIYDIRQQKHWRLTNNDGLPNNRLHSAVLDGQKAWLGGEGFVALLDLLSKRVERAIRFSSGFRLRSMALVGNDLWFSSGPGLYRLPKDAVMEASQDEPVSTVLAASAPEITDIHAARELLKKLDEVYRIHGSEQAAEYRQITARYHAFVRRAARDFPLLEPSGRKGTNHFFERTMNKDGRGYDGFRFKDTLAEPADFGWIFACERPASFRKWFMLPVEEDLPTVKFSEFDHPRIAYTNAPWTNLKSEYAVVLQYLNHGQLKSGKEYIVWLDFQDERPARFFLAFDLFPTSAGHWQNSVLEDAFGLSGPPLRGGP